MQRIGMSYLCSSYAYRNKALFARDTRIIHLLRSQGSRDGSGGYSIVIGGRIGDADVEGYIAVLNGKVGRTNGERYVIGSDADGHSISAEGCIAVLNGKVGRTNGKRYDIGADADGHSIVTGGHSADTDG